MAWTPTDKQNEAVQGEIKTWSLVPSWLNGELEQEGEIQIFLVIKNKLEKLREESTGGDHRPQQLKNMYFHTS